MATPTVDKEDCLVDPSEWIEDWARETELASGVALTDEHQVAADARFIMRRLSEARSASRNCPFALSRFGYPGQTCKIAGIRRPRAWSVG